MSLAHPARLPSRERNDPPCTSIQMTVHKTTSAPSARGDASIGPGSKILARTDTLQGNEGQVSLRLPAGA